MDFAPRTLKDLGIDESHAEYMVEHAHQMHGPGAFDNEVQNHIRQWTPADAEGQKRMDQSQRLKNVSLGSSPVIPAPGSASFLKDSTNPPMPGLPGPMSPPTMPSAPSTS